MGLFTTAGYRIKAGGRAGTAWLVWPRLAVTAFHVVGSCESATWSHEPAGRRDYSLELPDRRKVPLEPLSYDPIADIAVLEMPEGSALPEDGFLLLAEQPAKPGDPWRALGYPASVGVHYNAVVIGGHVQHVWPAHDSTALQLLVHQGTVVTWEGISGAAVRNIHGEVVGIITKTVAHVSTCTAAPVGALRRLLAFREKRPALAQWAERLHELVPGDRMEELLTMMNWLCLYSVDPPQVQALLPRAAQEGYAGVRRLMDAAKEVVGESDALGELRRRIDAACGDPVDPAEVDAVLAALLDDPPTLADLARVTHLPEDTVVQAVREIREAGMLEKDRLRLTARGARRALRSDHAVLLLRSLDGRQLSMKDLGLPIPPRSLTRLERGATLLGWLGGGEDLRCLTSAGSAALGAVKRGFDPTEVCGEDGREEAT